MPFLTEVTPFTGDNDMADFMTNVWLPFARDDVLWADDQSPTRSPEVATPEFEIWTHRVQRVGSPTVPVSPFTPLPPYVQYRSDDTGDNMHIFTSFGVDDTQDAYDQPNNPMNAPQNADFSLNSPNVATARCMLMNDMVGTFQTYWMFADTAGTYVHCVVKVAQRQYRHFHVGMLVPLHPDLSDDAFYVTGHWWDKLDPSSRTTAAVTFGSGTVDGSHAPYNTQHLLPFSMRTSGNELANTSATRMQLQGNIFYMPGLAQNSPEIVWYKAMTGDELTAQDAFGFAIQKGIGDVNNANNAVIFGIANVGGWANSLGTALYNADRTFSSNASVLNPINVGANVDFQSANRLGMVAQIPDVFRINMKNIAAEAEITVGSDTYVCFPLMNKDNANVLSGEGYSAYEGLAYKKITATVD